MEIIGLVGPRDEKGEVLPGKVRAVRLALPPLAKLHPVFHVSMIKEYKSDGQQHQVMPLQFDSDGSPQWEVDHIKGERASGRGKRVKEFLVSWKGFGPEHDSWEPEVNVSCKTLIEDFRRSQAARPEAPKSKKSRKKT